MNLYSKFSVLGAALVLTTALASADTLTLGSWATGGSNPGVTNTAMNFAGFQAIPQPVTTPPPAINPQSGTASTFFLDPSNVWKPALGNSTWVGSTATSGPVGTVNPAYGYYTYTTTFTAAGGLYNGFINVMADDTTEVLLNGVMIIPLGGLGSDAHCADNKPTCLVEDKLNLTGINLNGSNTLTFVVQQQGTGPIGGTGDPSGVDFDASLTAVPEPSSLLLLGTGLIGSAGALFRRMRA
jgi:hypothetical protein